MGSRWQLVLDYNLEARAYILTVTDTLYGFSTVHPLHQHVLDDYLVEEGSVTYQAIGNHVAEKHVELFNEAKKQKG